MSVFKARSDSSQRRDRSRSSAYAARTNKGHPKRVARQERAAIRLANHVYNPERCGKNCPKK